MQGDLLCRIVVETPVNLIVAFNVKDLLKDLQATMEGEEGGQIFSEEKNLSLTDSFDLSETLGYVRRSTAVMNLRVDDLEDRLRCICCTALLLQAASVLHPPSSAVAASSVVRG